MIPVVSVKWGKEAGLGVKSIARKPVNKKPERILFWRPPNKLALC